MPTIDDPTGTLTAEVRGDGPLVVAVHGVGIGPASFTPLAASLARHATVAVVHRPGYGRRSDDAPVPVDDQVAALAALVAALGQGPALLVGVSGGATLGLLTAIDHPGALGAAVLHEPLVGPLAPELHAGLVRRATRLAEDPDPAAPATFLADLVGPAIWQRLPEPWHDAIVAAGATIRSEVADFARVAPTRAQLRRRRGVAPALVVTVGSRSGAARRQAAGVLVDEAGASVHTLAGVGHLAHVEAPVVLGRIIRPLLVADVAGAAS